MREARLEAQKKLRLACQEGRAEVVMELLKSGVDVNALQDGHSSPLQIASLNGHVKVVEVLLNHKADIDLRDASGFSAFDFARHAGKTDVMALLLERGAKAEPQTHTPSVPPVSDKVAIAGDRSLDAFLKADEESFQGAKLSDVESPAALKETQLKGLASQYGVVRKAFATGNYDAAVDALMNVVKSIYGVIGKEAGGPEFAEALEVVIQSAGPRYFDHMMATELANASSGLGEEAMYVGMFQQVVWALKNEDKLSDADLEPAAQLYQLRESAEEFYSLGRNNPFDPLVQRLVGNDKLDNLLKNISFLIPGTLSDVVGKFPSPAEKLAVLEKIFTAVSQQQHQQNKIAQRYKNLLGSPYSNQQQKDIKLLQKAALRIIKNNPDDPKVKAHVKESKLLNAETRDIYLNVPGHMSDARKRVVAMYVKKQDSDAVLSQMSALFQETRGIIPAIKKRILLGLLPTKGIVEYMLKKPEHIQFLLPLVKGRRDFAAVEYSEEGKKLFAEMIGDPQKFNTKKFLAQHPYTTEQLKGLGMLFLERRGNTAVGENIQLNFHKVIAASIVQMSVAESAQLMDDTASSASSTSESSPAVSPRDAKTMKDLVQYLEEEIPATKERAKEVLSDVLNKLAARELSDEEKAKVDKELEDLHAKAKADKGRPKKQFEPKDRDEEELLAMVDALSRDGVQPHDQSRDLDISLLKNVLNLNDKRLENKLEKLLDEHKGKLPDEDALGKLVKAINDNRLTPDIQKLCEKEPLLEKMREAANLQLQEHRGLHK